jgi:hypothetical protein
MKPVLYWTLTRSRFAHNYAAFAVTSEGPRNRINGRFADDHPSHTTKYDCVGRFDTQAAAEAKVSEIKAIRERFNAVRKPYHDAINVADQAEDAAIKEATKAQE